MAATQHAAAAEETSFRRARNRRLRQAVHRHKATTRQGIQERLFTLAFSGLVYPQIWEDPVVDMEALDLRAGRACSSPSRRAAATCSAILTAAPIAVTAVDLNPAHVALNKLKLAALAHLPDYDAFCRFFGEADARANIDAYFDAAARRTSTTTTRAYWEARDRFGRRRIGYFARNFYRHGLLGHFIGAGHLARPRCTASTRAACSRRKTLDEQRRIFESELAPLFDKRHVRWLLDRPAALFGLGIPPSQFTALEGGEAQHGGRARGAARAAGLRLRPRRQLFRLAGVRPPLRDRGRRRRCRPICSARASPVCARAPADVTVVHASFTEHLAAQPAASLDAYVLLDAQDWMTDAQLNALWARSCARHGPAPASSSALRGRRRSCPDACRTRCSRRFAYDRERMPAAGRAQDRSSIYGGFHLYVFQG